MAEDRRDPDGRDPSGGGLATTRGLGAERDQRVLRFAALAVGAVFAGRYEIRQRLGSGGSGEVLLAFDLTAATDVALKVLYPTGEAPEATLERLRRELHIVRGLAHPGIVRVHDIGDHDGLLYLVMDRLEGETLAARLRRGPLGMREACDLFERLLEALAAAHAKGIVHRDIKPANIFLTAAGPVLLDFGLARRRDDPLLTRAGAIVGTPQYAAPEQAAGEQTGPPGDLYSLAVVVWEMLDGRAPFEEVSGFATPHAARRVRTPLPASAAVRRAPASVRDLLDRMLDAIPARRPKDGAEALAVLRRNRRRGPLRRAAARALSTFRRARAARPRRTVRIAAAVLVAVGIVGAALVPASRPRGTLDSLIVPSLAGITLHRIPVPGCVVASAPIDRWRHLVLMHERPETDGRRYPFVLDVLDTVTGRLSPLAIATINVRAPASSFPRFSAHYRGAHLQRLAVRDPVRGRPLYAVIFAHESAYPRLLFIVDDTGQTFLEMSAAGSIFSPIVVPAAAGGPPLFVVAVEQWGLDQRPSLVAVPFGRVHEVPLALGTVEASPNPYSYAGSASPAWTTYFSSSRIPTATLDGDTLAVVDHEAQPIGRVDARTGTPAGLAASARARWLDDQRELHRLLMTGTPAAEADRRAAEFEAFAGRPGLDASQRGIALGRASDAWRTAGDLGRALAAAEAAARTEPGILGHLRRLVDLHALAGDAPAIARLKELHAADRIGQWAEFRRDVAVAEILLGRHEAVLAARGFQTSYAEFVTAAARIDLGGYDVAAEDFARNPDTECRTNADLAFLAATAEILRAQPNVERAREFLAIVERGRGAGRHPPRELLEMLLEAREARPAAPLAARVTRVQQLLAGHREAGRHDIVDRLYARWAERIGARLISSSSAPAGGPRRSRSRRRRPTSARSPSPCP